MIDFCVWGPVEAQVRLPMVFAYSWQVCQCRGVPILVWSPIDVKRRTFLGTFDPVLMMRPLLW
jgi:hypothetical protein